MLRFSSPAAFSLQPIGLTGDFRTLAQAHPARLVARTTPSPEG